MVIFHSYVRLPEGKGNHPQIATRFRWVNYYNLLRPLDESLVSQNVVIHRNIETLPHNTLYYYILHISGSAGDPSPLVGFPHFHSKCFSGRIACSTRLDIEQKTRSQRVLGRNVISFPAHFPLNQSIAETRFKMYSWSTWYSFPWFPPYLSFFPNPKWMGFRLWSHSTSPTPWSHHDCHGYHGFGHGLSTRSPEVAAGCRGDPQVTAGFQDQNRRMTSMIRPV